MPSQKVTPRPLMDTAGPGATASRACHQALGMKIASPGAKDQKLLTSMFFGPKSQKKYWGRPKTMKAFFGGEVVLLVFQKNINNANTPVFLGGYGLYGCLLTPGQPVDPTCFKKNLQRMHGVRCLELLPTQLGVARSSRRNFRDRGSKWCDPNWPQKTTKGGRYWIYNTLLCYMLWYICWYVQYHVNHVNHVDTKSCCCCCCPKNAGRASMFAQAWEGYDRSKMVTFASMMDISFDLIQMDVSSRKSRSIIINATSFCIVLPCVGQFSRVVQETLPQQNCSERTWE